MELMFTRELDSMTHRKDWYSIVIPYYNELKEKFKNKNYGKGVDVIIIHFGVYFDPTSYTEKGSYDKDEKTLVLVESLPTYGIIEDSPEELINRVKAGIRSSLNRFVEIKNVPKDFDYPAFRSDLLSMIQEEEE